MVRSKLLITGGKGFIGRECAEGLRDFYRIAAPGRDACDVMDAASVSRMMDEFHPDVVLHLAALVEKQRCERFPGLASAVNAEGAGIVADAATARGARLVFLSTDYVFGGERTKPFTEADAPHPVNVYGRTKCEGERRVRERAADALIVRTSRVFGARGANFFSSLPALVRTEKTLRVADDMRSGATYAPDLVRVLHELIRREVSGIVHVANAGDCTPAEFAEAAAAATAATANLVRVRYIDLGNEVATPEYCVLDTHKCAAHGVPPLRSWRDALKEFLSHAR